MREPNGKLRMASHDERDRMLQVYFPVPGRMYATPEMFQEQNIEVSRRVAHLSLYSTVPAYFR